MPEKNDALKNLQFQMELDSFRKAVPYIIENAALNAKIMKARYDSLLNEGFTEEQALEIVVHKPITEM